MPLVIVKYITFFVICCSRKLFLFALTFHNFDSKIRYYRIDPSLKEWATTFSTVQDSIGSVHIWMSCINKKIRGIIHIESMSDFDRHLDDTASYSKLDWEKSESKFNVYLNGEKVRIINSQMPWNKALSSTSVFYHDLSKIGENDFFELKINNWQRVHMINLNMLSKPQAVAQDKRQVILSVNFADKSNHLNFYESVKPHVIYHEASQQIYKYQLIVREHELNIMKNDEFIVSAVNRGFMTIFVKPNYLPQVKGHSFRWQAVLENLSLL